MQGLGDDPLSALRGADEVVDREVRVRRTDALEELLERREERLDVREPHEDEEVARVDVAEGERERLRGRVEGDVGRVLLHLARESLGLDAEARVAPVLLGRNAERAVLPVRVDDDARHPVAEQLLDQNAEQVALPAAGLREDADVALDELVDVELDPEVVVAQETDVRPDVRTVLEAEDVGDQRLLGAVDVRPRSERDGRDLDEPLPVAVADDAGGPEQVLVDRRLVLRPEAPRALEVEVALALQVVELAEDLAVLLVLDREVIAAFDRVRKAQLELAEPDVAEDPPDLFHARFIEGAGY